MMRNVSESTEPPMGNRLCRACDHPTTYTALALKAYTARGYFSVSKVCYRSTFPETVRKPVSQHVPREHTLFAQLDPWHANSFRPAALGAAMVSGLQVRAPVISGCKV